MSKSNSLSIKSQIMLNRYIESDAQCVEFRVEAELRMANDGIDLESTESRRKLNELQQYEFKAFYRDTGRVTTYDYSVVEHSLAIERFSENDHFETIIKTFREIASHTDYAEGEDFVDKNFTRINPSLRKNIENTLSPDKEEHQKQLDSILNYFWTGVDELDFAYIDTQSQKEFDLIQKELLETHKMASNPHRPR
ncbi:MAG: hypothetical protein JEY79_17015 [Pseudodesulfovibrio sp.]|nr:hypothetical protein [Pseudodesulfovibrio sp.]